MVVRWTYRVLIALAAFVFAAGMAGGGIALAAGGSLPGDPLYPLKIAAEDARLSLTRAPPALASLNLALASQRAPETRMARHTEGAIEQIVRVEPARAPADALENPERAHQAAGAELGVAQGKGNESSMGVTDVLSDTEESEDEDEDVDRDEEVEKDKDGDGMTGLVIHPAHLNAGGKCRELYVARGSLKNHGPGLATGVVISAEVVSGTEWVTDVEVSPTTWLTLSTSKPGRFIVEVSTNDKWSSAGKGSVIQVRVYVLSAEDVPIEGGEAIFTVRNQCKDESLKGAEGSEKPDKPGKPEKAPKEKPQGKPEKPGRPPGKPEKPGKPPKPGKPGKGE